MKDKINLQQFAVENEEEVIHFIFIPPASLTPEEAEEQVQAFKEYVKGFARKVGCKYVG